MKTESPSEIAVKYFLGATSLVFGHLNCVRPTHIGVESNVDFSGLLSPLSVQYKLFYLIVLCIKVLYGTNMCIVALFFDVTK